MIRTKLGVLLRQFSTSPICHTVEPNLEPYSYMRKEQYQKLILKSPLLLLGHFNAQGSTAFKARHKHRSYKSLIHSKDLQISSIGVGTYKGSHDNQDDLLMFNGLVDSVRCGVNVIDTCNNFRGGRSEIVVGQALQHLVASGQGSREEFMVSSKAGYVRERLPATIPAEDVVNDHCVHPQYLEECLNRTLKAMNLTTIDVFYLNNVLQCHWTTDTDKLFTKICKAFQFLEKARQQKKIKSYGVASWQAFRLKPTEKGHFSLDILKTAAQRVAGQSNGFQFLQVPINIMMPEAFADRTQKHGTLLETAEKLKMNVISTSPLLSGALINVPLPSSLLNCRFNGSKHLQLIRSIPCRSLVSTLIGHKRNRHLKKNLEVLSIPALREQQWLKVFLPAKDGANQGEVEDEEDQA